MLGVDGIAIFSRFIWWDRILYIYTTNYTKLVELKRSVAKDRQRVAKNMQNVATPTSYSLQVYIGV